MNELTYSKILIKCHHYGSSVVVLTSYVGGRGQEPLSGLTKTKQNS